MKVHHPNGVVLHPFPAVALDMESVVPLPEVPKRADRRQIQRPRGLPLDAQQPYYENHQENRIVSLHHFRNRSEAAHRAVTFRKAIFAR